MASSSIATDQRQSQFTGALSDPKFAIGGANFDAFLLWGVPLLSLIAVMLWITLAAALPVSTGTGMLTMLMSFTIILTFAHLFAVIPRAYLNKEVFESNRVRLTVIPVLLIAGLVCSPVIFAIGGVVVTFWDIHHSAMQNFGLARIYDMKAGHNPEMLRKVDLRLNWVLYVGPLIAGSAFLSHLRALDDLSAVGLVQIARLPGLLQGETPLITGIAFTAWGATLAWAAMAYRSAYRSGYRMPVHKAALVGSTGLVSLIAWGFSSPAVALLSVNIYHAVQYFALVWVKEGGRMKARTGAKGVIAILLFCGACGAAGVLYSQAEATKIQWVVAPFIACSLLHFWFDSFVWSVRKKQV
jgi:hypothetical protein